MTPVSSSASSTLASARRRRLLLAGTAGAGTGLAAGGLWLAAPAAATGAFESLPQAYKTLEALHRGNVRMLEGWDLATVLHHAAQSVEYSMQGYPQLKGAWFRASVGPAAFAAFDHFHTMRHNLAEPIPGAPAIAAGQALGPAIEHAVAALQAFERHPGPLAPHFAYGDLDKARYLRAHLLHFSDHWQRVAA
jgi:hypothetical protein